MSKKTGKAVIQIGIEINHKLAHTPGSYFLKEIIRSKYAHPKEKEFGITIALLPDSIILKCLAEESLLPEMIRFFLVRLEAQIN